MRILSPKNILALITPFLLCACGADELIKDPTPPPYIDSDFAPILGNFRNEATLYGRNDLKDVLIVKYVDKRPSPTSAGRCYKAKDKFVEYDPNAITNHKVKTVEWREILVDRALAEEPEHVRQYIVYHELGHCMLNLKHTDNPDDLMFSEYPEFTQEEFEERFPSMVKTMFETK